MCEVFCYFLDFFDVFFGDYCEVVKFLFVILMFLDGFCVMIGFFVDMFGMYYEFVFEDFVIEDEGVDGVVEIYCFGVCFVFLVWVFGLCFLECFWVIFWWGEFFYV